MKILLFGTPQFAASCLEELAYSKSVEILGVFTQPDKNFGRHQELISPEVKMLAEKLHLPIFQPKDQNELINKCKEFETDFFVVIAFGMIFPKEVLAIPKYGCINVHASLLPKYRGASPIQESLLHGDKETGITIIEMDEKLDHGDIYLLRRVQIYDTDNYSSLSKRLAEIASKMLPHTLEDIETGLLKKIPQDENHQKPSYCRKITKIDGEIKKDKTAKQIICMLKAYTPWPGVFINFNGKRLKILDATLDTATNAKEIHRPGSLILDNGILKLVTTESQILPTKLQVEGKKPVNAKEFINGNLNNLPKN